MGRTVANMIADLRSFIAGVQVGRRLKVADAMRKATPPLPPVTGGKYIVTETGVKIITEQTGLYMVTEEVAQDG